MVVKNLLVRCGADFSALTTGSKKASASMRYMQKSVNTSTSAMTKSLGMLKSAMGALGLTVGAYALVSFGKSAIKAASDLQEIQNVVDVTFGVGNKTIENFAKSAVNSFGLSTFAAKKYTSNIGAMGKSMGFASAQNEQMSTTLTGLIGDFASFRNITTDEAYTAMSAIYTGETETLKRYGILITEVNLQEYARTQGITKSINAMTQQEKVMLRYNYILKVTKDAQGDFVRTSGSWANQTRVLSQRWQEFLALMGNGLIQVFTPVLKFLNYVMSAMIQFANAFSSVTAALFGKQTSVASTSDAAADAQLGLADATTAAGDAAKGALAGFDKLNVLQKNTAGASIGSLGAITPLSGTIGGEVKVDDKLMTGLDLLKEKMSVLAEPVSKLKESFLKFKDAIVDFWNNSGIQPLVKTFVEKELDKYINLLSGAILGLSGVLDTVSGILTMITGILSGDFKKAGEGAGLTFSGLGKIIESTFVAIFGKTAVDNVKTACSTMATNISTWFNNDVKKWFTVEQWSTLWNNVKKGFNDGWWTVKNWWNTSAMGNWWNENVSPWFTSEKWTGLWSTVKKGWNDGWWNVKNWWNNSAIGSWWTENVAPWFTAQKWANVMSGVADGFKAAFKAAIQGVIDLINSFLKSKEFNYFRDLYNSTAGKVFGEIPELKIPPLAKGGIATSETVARIGEAGREAVLPLENNTGWMDTLAAKIGSQSIVFEGADDIMQLVRILQPKIVKNTNRVGTKLVNEGGLL